MKKQRFVTSIIFSVIGTLIVSLLNHFVRGAEFTWTNTIVNLILFFIVGYFFGKIGPKHKIDL